MRNGINFAVQKVREKMARMEELFTSSGIKRRIGYKNFILTSFPTPP